MAADAITVRPGRAGDLPDVAEIQAACPEAAPWEVRDYLAQDFVVAECDSRVVGFAVARKVAEEESELLNLAVRAEFRRRGIGRSLVQHLRTGHRGDLFLEVRQSNQAAQKFYQVIGFKAVGRREGYYSTPPEAAVVMKFHSCYCHK